MNRLAACLHVFCELSFVLCSLVLAGPALATIISYEIRAPHIAGFDDCVLVHIRG